MLDRSIYLMGIVWAMYLIILLPAYLMKEIQCGETKAVHDKMALSGTFCAIGLGAVFLQDASLVSILIFIGLISAMIGDYFLVFINVNDIQFICGIVCFGITQLSYIAAMAVLAGFGYLEFVLTAAVVIPVLIGRQLLKIDMGKATWPLSAYSSLVAFMAIKAMLLACSGHPPFTGQWLFSAGALLFLTSDIFLGVRTYIKKTKLFTGLVSICYFLGQLMIVTAIFYQKL